MIRRTLAALFVAGTLFALPLDGARAEPRHGLSSFGELKYSAGFTHFNYVNPSAPKGGRLSMVGAQGTYNTNPATFNTFNGYVLQGDAPYGIEYLFDSLMVRAYDEPDAVYGLVAHSADVNDSGTSVTFHLRPEARFADGTAVTAEDVAWTFHTLKEHGHPALTSQIRDVVRAIVIDAHTIRYEFDGETTRDLPVRVALLPVFSLAYYADRDFAAGTLEAPLGSGPYGVGDFQQGRYVSYLRREDYWARDLPVNLGRFNFDELRFEYFRDRTAEFEALKAGEYDLREEFTAKTWATGYDLRAVYEGTLIRDVLPDDRPSGAQGFFINTRQAKFADPRVRRALDLAFDFEWANEHLFHGLYRRTHSFFENTDMMADGAPGTAELALLNPHRAELPADVFEDPYVPPVSDASGQDRELLREATALLDEAGWHIVDGVRVNDAGEALTIEFLTYSTAMERVIATYIHNLDRLGIDANIRRVDAAQFQERVTAFDFDVVARRYALSSTPGTELRSYWGSTQADTLGSLNLAGIADPVVDALIENVIAAQTRDGLVAATRAVDRVLRAGHYWIPHWHRPNHTIAYWNRFSRPQFKPKYHRGIVDTWWFDAEKAAELDYAE
jgi:microcin C transport system substrate-binding protein